jgi:hypothetical protein
MRAGWTDMPRAPAAAARPLRQRTSARRRRRGIDPYLWRPRRAPAAPPSRAIRSGKTFRLTRYIPRSRRAVPNRLTTRLAFSLAPDPPAGGAYVGVAGQNGGGVERRCKAGAGPERGAGEGERLGGVRGE